MKLLWQIADLARDARRRLRFGELSRAPLRLTRLEVRGSEASCEWLVRPPDEWDENLRRREREQNVSQQALRDAVAIRELVFGSLPDIEQAVLRAFRPSPAREPPQLVIAGYVSRSDPEALRVSSWAMKAKLYGLKFRLDDGILQMLEDEDVPSFQEVDEPNLRI